MARKSARESRSGNSSTTTKQQFWQKHCTRWQQRSGSKLSYCREHALNYHQFIYWQKQITTRESVEEAPVAKGALVPVAVSSAHEAAELRITLPNGVCIAGIDTHNLHLASSLIATL